MVIRSRAPLRIGFAGGGTDVSVYSDEFGGLVLNATINLYAHCTLELTSDDKICMSAHDRNEYFCTNVKYPLDVDDPLKLHKGVYNKIINRFNNNKPISLRLSTYADAQAGSGLGSSSTMVVAILKAYVEALNLQLDEYELAHLAFEIERNDLGLVGGKQDQYAATFGGFNFIEFYKNGKVIVNPLRVKDWIICELESSMILYYTGISRESAKIIEGQIKGTIEKRVNVVNAMHELKSDALMMKEVLLKGNIRTFANYLDKSWREKKMTCSDVSNCYLDKIHDTAINAGAYAGKVSGAGGGGYMLFITDPLKKLDVINALYKMGGKVISYCFTSDGTKAWRIY